MKPETRLREMNITLECRRCGETAIVDMKAPEAKEKYNAFFEKHPAFCGKGSTPSAACGRLLPQERGFENDMEGTEDEQDQD